MPLQHKRDRAFIVQNIILKQYFLVLLAMTVGWNSWQIVQKGQELQN